MALNSKGYKVGKQPIAQSFFISEPTGIYCTKFDLFLSKADENASIQIEVRPMINGFPSSSDVLPGSIKSLPGSTFTGGSNLSNDATVAVSFELDEPLFLKGQTDYALVVTADSKDYEIFIAQINDFVDNKYFDIFDPIFETYDYYTHSILYNWIFGIIAMLYYCDNVFELL